MASVIVKEEEIVSDGENTVVVEDNVGEEEVETETLPKQQQQQTTQEECGVGSSNDDVEIDCQICEKRFSDTSVFFSHWQSHSPVPYIKPYTCHICGKSYIANYFLVQHNQIHLAEESMTHDTVQEIEIENDDGAGGIEMEEVISYVHEDGGGGGGGPTTFVCDICKTTYPDEMSLRRHSVTHSRKRNFHAVTVNADTCIDPFNTNRAYRRRDVVTGDNGKNYEKPSCSYATLIAMAIRANNNRITLLDIYSWIMEHFPYYKNTTRNWQNSIRHTLSLHPYFVRIPRSEPGARSGFWTIDERVLKEGRKYRRNDAFRWAVGEVSTSSIGGEEESDDRDISGIVDVSSTDAHATILRKVVRRSTPASTVYYTDS